MRISDWSSDVCSSDLLRGDVRAIEDFFRARYGREALFLPSGRLALYLAFRQWLHPGDRVLMSPVTDDEIGRASCRERVSVRVVLGGRRSIKKKNKADKVKTPPNY